MEGYPVGPYRLFMLFYNVLLKKILWGGTFGTTLERSLLTFSIMTCA